MPVFRSWCPLIAGSSLANPGGCTQTCAGSSPTALRTLASFSNPECANQKIDVPANGSAYVKIVFGESGLSYAIGAHVIPAGVFASMIASNS